MRYILIIVFSFLFGIESFGQVNLEMEIISALLKSEFNLKSNDTVFTTAGKIKEIKVYKNPKIVLINETSGSYASGLSFKFLKGNLTMLDSEAFNDFSLKNKSDIRIDSIKGFGDVITYLTNAEIKNVFEAGGWEGFRKRFGYSPVVNISRPGINKNKDIAIVYYSRSSDYLAGSGELLIFQKIKGVWIRKEWMPLWIS